MSLNTLSELKRVLGQDNKRAAKVMEVTNVDGEQVICQNQETTIETRTTLPGIVVGDSIIVRENVVIGFAQKAQTTVFIT